ncbi:MAG: GNAT family N-acetyltransferase [Defluviitaleaceae bacterium]|nr:GNAT family N-acetyltransferase [Defluviitaleaceae bacterium]
MKFVFPNISYEDKAFDYIREFASANSKAYGSGGLARAVENNLYAEWLLEIVHDFDIANLQGDDVPSLTYFAVREHDDELVGTCNVRLALNDFLRREAGHIGFSVRPAERRKGYATAILQKAVMICNAVGINDVMVTCDKDNTASAGVIRKCGGVMEDEFYSDTFKGLVQRYWIRRGA